MQETRRHILEILREAGEATVDDIVALLQRRRGKEITAVTVRHHLNMLQRDELITPPQPRHRSSPGRPQHIYALTEKAREHFPNNYQHLVANLLSTLRDQLPADGVNVIMEGVAFRMAGEAQIPNLPLVEKLPLAVDYLTSRGYNASWEACDEGYMLHTSNCPYHHIARDNQLLCDIDMRLVSSLLGVVPRMIQRVMDGGATCAYLISDKRHQ